MSLYIGIISSYPATASLLLDLYPGAFAAYSTRKLRSAYGSSAIRVRRDLDNAEQDIGFVNNELDTASLLAFTGSENYAVWSQNFTQSNWTRTNTTVTLNAAVAPDGTTTANNCVIANNSNVKAIFQGAPSVSTRNIVFSVYAKANQYNYVQLMAIRDSTNRYSIIVNLTNGLITQSNSVGTPNFVSSSVTSVGNGWYRIAITLNINLGTNYMVFSPSPVANPTLNASLDLTSAGDGTSGVLLWGAQLNYTELKPYQVTTTNQAIYCSAFVTTWYDQSGGGRNVTQATAGFQPTIVNAGALTTENNKPTLSFNVDFLQSSVTKSFKPVTTFIAGRHSSGAIIIGGASGSYELRLTSSSQIQALQLYTAAIGTSASSISSDFGLISTRFTAAGVYDFFRNNLTLGGGGTSGTSISNVTFAIAAEGSSASTGSFSEVIYYDSDQLANRTAISTNINTYFSIYVAKWSGNGTALLDTYSGAVAAYSLRNLSSTYTGPLIRVRRSVDGAEQDIYGLANGGLDTGSLISFCDSTTYGYVTTWYDQSGNGYHLTQTAAAVQPVIIALGVVQLFGTKPTINFQVSRSGGGGPSYLENTVISANQPNTYFIVNQATSATGTGDRNVFDSTSANRNAIGKSNANVNYFMFAGTLVYSTTPYDVAKNLFVPIFNNASSYFYKNSTAILSAVNPGSQSLGGLRLACYQGTQANYESIMPEFIVYNSNQSANRAAIENNINSYYSIY